jgi:hypothetical protein
LLAAPLVVVPVLMEVLPDRWVGAGVDTHALATMALALGLLLPVALLLPRGPVSAMFAVPWLVVAGVAATAGIRDAIAHRIELLRPARAADLATDAALVGLMVGAIWLVIDRTGLQVPGIPVEIATLTAVHFHFAAFGLVGIAALASMARPRRATWLATMVLIAGIWITAAGFVLPSHAVSWVGAVLVGMSGLTVAAVLFHLAVGALIRVACATLALGMVLAIAWPTSLVLWPGLLDIGLMVRTHGVLNASAVMLLAWTTDRWLGAHRGGSRSPGPAGSWAGRSCGAWWQLGTRSPLYPDGTVST